MIAPVKMSQSRDELDKQDARRLQKRQAMHSRAQIQEMADNLGIPLYIRPDGKPQQKFIPGAEVITPKKRDDPFDRGLPTPEKPPAT